MAGVPWSEACIAAPAPVRPPPATGVLFPPRVLFPRRGEEEKPAAHRGGRCDGQLASLRGASRPPLLRGPSPQLVHFTDDVVLAEPFPEPLSPAV